MGVGIVCDINYSWCFNLKQYYYAVKSLYKDVKIVDNISDLDGIELLFIGDDHTVTHKKVITQTGFVEKCNANDIKVVVMTSERIFDSFFPWNVDNYNFIKRFRNLYHYTGDVDDCIKLGTKLNRTVFSKHFKDYVITDNKKDEIVFIGHANSKCYNERMDILDQIKKLIPVTIISPTMNSWDEYIKTLSQYRFVLSPIGNGNIFTFRFYEALLVHSIPIHQVKENTLKYYDIEAKFNDCIYFQSPDEIVSKIKDYPWDRSHSELWFEDVLGNLLREDGLL
jgi:hypothetical protein